LTTPSFTRSVTLLGATGSVGRSTARVIEELRASGQADIHVEALTAGSDVQGLAALVKSLKPRFVALASETALADAREALSGLNVEVGVGPDALLEAASRPADWVLSAIVGVAGMAPTRAAVRRGATVALANKESVVCGGRLLMDEAARHGAKLIPVDSEHNAVFQAMGAPETIEKVTLTASGGPFRAWALEAMANASPDQACAHPNWSMGKKISIDSATLMNKGLEVIEAAYLFDLPSEKLEVLVHPQSIVHALVAYRDGSVLAQLAAPDMRTPIAYALSWPDRAQVSTPRLDLAKTAQLQFEAPDLTRFPALGLARAALEAGGAAPALLNAANETAVAAFLERRIGFLDIARVVETVLERHSAGQLAEIAKSPSSFDEVVAVDAAGRRAAAMETQRRCAA
jgi:1-deoxy-D-xylulose-5-phosphate reductoisomerase